MIGSVLIPTGVFLFFVRILLTKVARRGISMRRRHKCEEKAEGCFSGSGMDARLRYERWHVCKSPAFLYDGLDQIAAGSAKAGIYNDNKYLPGRIFRQFRIKAV